MFGTRKAHLKIIGHLLVGFTSRSGRVGTLHRWKIVLFSALSLRSSIGGGGATRGRCVSASRAKSQHGRSIGSGRSGLQLRMAPLLWCAHHIIAITMNCCRLLLCLLLCLHLFIGTMTPGRGGRKIRVVIVQRSRVGREVSTARGRRRVARVVVGGGSCAQG